MDIYQVIPESHFDPVMSRTIDALKRGESVCVYGMLGVGRTFFSRQLERLLKDKKIADVVIYLEPLSFDEDPSQYMKNILLDLKFVDKHNFFASLRNYLENHKVVIIINFIEQVSEKRKLLDLLIELRRLHSTNMNIFTTCDQSVISHPGDFLSHSKHFADSFFVLPPLDLKGTREVIRHNGEFFLWRVKESLAQDIFKLSGGNGGLIKYICKAVDENGKEILSRPDELLEYPPLKIRLEALLRLTLTQSPKLLRQIKVVTEKMKPFSKLLGIYIKNFSLANIDIAFPELTRLERKILSFFVINEGKVIDKETVAFWMEMSEDEYSLWAIYKIVSRLRKKIRGRYNLDSIKGRGYCLTSVKV